MMLLVWSKPGIVGTQLWSPNHGNFILGCVIWILDGRYRHHQNVSEFLP
jgi:hypothetical protein